ncbi:unnamed protein product, partial [Amoebophrya sp. A120]|eukprot:GSA120T00018186001.1
MHTSQHSWNPNAPAFNCAYHDDTSAAVSSDQQLRYQQEQTAQIMMQMQSQAQAQQAQISQGNGPLHMGMALPMAMPVPAQMMQMSPGVATRPSAAMPCMMSGPAPVQQMMAAATNIAGGPTMLGSRSIAQ